MAHQLSEEEMNSPPDLSTLSVTSSANTPPTLETPPPPPPPLDSPTPPHRSHDPTNNLKRSDPFQFGSRYLLPSDDPYEFNAWDHVETDSTYKAHAEAMYASQRASPVSAFDKTRFNTDPAKWWNKFYTNNTSNFFKDRKWLRQEFPILDALTKAQSTPAKILEVGAGAGNTAFPILAANENPNLVLHACDFSTKAVELIRSSPAYSPQHIQASFWDIASDTLPENVHENSIDVVLLVFIFSALSPQQWRQAVRNVFRVLKPGGEVCFRDYGRGDLAQVRFRKGRWMEENFYVRGDGTRVYFFDEEELRGMWGGGMWERQQDGDGDFLQKTTTLSHSVDDAVLSSLDASSDFTQSFEIVSLGVDRRLLINRQSKVKMYRCWMQGRFQKPDAVKSPEPAVSACDGHF